MRVAAELRHGTAVAVARRGILIRGPSGSGKSDLALRLLALSGSSFAGRRPITLIADDQVLLSADAGTVSLRAPPAIAGKLEVRGVGIVDAGAETDAKLALVVDLAAAADIPRLPDPGDRVDLVGVSLPRIRIVPFEASAPLKVLLALDLAT